ncbi:MAG: leucine-rich repeat domain-containing protein [Muribaculum sp.]|nr:leucine-rich repeat domain-containing protein [Muribaculum sp.]
MKSIHIRKRVTMSLIALLTATLPSMADEYLKKTVDGIEYTVNLTTKEAAVTGGEYAANKNVVIFDHFLGYPVTTISGKIGSAFGPLTSITIPPTVTRIYASWYKSLQEVHISDLTAWCGIDFEYPDNSRSKPIKRITGGLLEDESNYVSAYNPLALNGNLYLNGELVEDLVIPAEITEIKSQAFCGAKIKSVTFNGPVYAIGDCAFTDCDIKSFRITDFKAWCEMNTGYSYHVIRDSYGYAKLIYYTHEWYSGSSLDLKTREAYRYYPLKDGVKLFVDNKEFPTDGELVIPQGCTALGDAFACTDITEVYMPASLTKMNSTSLYNCSKITKIDFPNSEFLFNNNIGNWLRTLSKLYIAGQESDGHLDCPGNIEILDNPNFFLSPLIKSIRFNPGLKEIKVLDLTSDQQLVNYYNNYNDYKKDMGVFQSCRNLKEISLPEGLAVIGENTFAYSGLETVTIPSTVKKIKNYGLNCPLSEIRVLASAPPYIYESTFPDRRYTTATLFVPKGSLNSYKRASYWKYFVRMEEFDPSFSGVDPTLQTPQRFIVRGNHLTFPEGLQASLLTIYDAGGKVIYTGSVKDQTLNPGIYLITLDGHTTKILIY